MQDEKDTLRQQLLTLQSEALAQVEQADGLEALEQIRIDYLGKKGKLSKILGGMGKLPQKNGLPLALWPTPLKRPSNPVWSSANRPLVKLNCWPA